MEEHYLPVSPSGRNRAPATNAVRRGEQNRRRGPHFPVEREVELAELGGRLRGEGRMEQISECGCLISTGDLPTPGTG